MTITLSKEDRVKKMVRNIMQDYTNATSIACIFVDIQGKERSSKYNFTKFCHFMRSVPEFRSKCYQCDLCGAVWKRSRTVLAAHTAVMRDWWISPFLSSTKTSSMGSSCRGRWYRMICASQICRNRRRGRRTARLSNISGLPRSTAMRKS